ncbi:hypothetical protein PISMIDRAFT_677391 [Pisolithus microcarpus 441]|uniref:Uncharacterized protein n=1 Tax=Pisolithus microcarpus 441 TaxID=765257 RepID=A0A0C9ZGM1_9AGAM|nr:hypothetical protein PISMIDRAFT_677391 [Pisolithus microcarpus 441]
MNVDSFRPWIAFHYPVGWHASLSASRLVSRGDVDIVSCGTGYRDLYCDLCERHTDAAAITWRQC